MSGILMKRSTKPECSEAHGRYPPREYLPEIWGGGEMADEEAFASQPQLKEFLDLVMRHWNAIAETLQSGDVHLPLLLEDEQHHPRERLGAGLPARDGAAASGLG